MPIFNEAHFLEESRVNLLVFIVNPSWDDFGGGKSRSQEKAKGDTQISQASHR
jgi:hypothetical protein